MSRMKVKQEKGTITIKNSGVSVMVAVIIQVSLCVLSMFLYTGLCMELLANQWFTDSPVLFQVSCSFPDILKCINLLYLAILNELVTSE